MLPNWTLALVLVSQIAVFFYLKPWRLMAFVPVDDFRAFRLKRQVQAFRNAGVL